MLNSSVVILNVGLRSYCETHSLTVYAASATKDSLWQNLEEILTM